MLKRKSIFDILREAEEDEGAADSGTETPAETDETQDAAPSAEESNEEGSEDDYGSEDDFDIDTSLDDDGGDDLDLGGDSGGGGSDTSTDTGSSSSSSDIDSEDEPVEANTDIFSSLTAEEQQVKIKELKNLYAELYTSVDDLLEKINDTDTDEDNIDILSRVSATLYTLKNYISDYLTTSFANKSYIENDIAFNRFLSILNSTASVVEDIGKIKADKLGLSDKK